MDAKIQLLAMPAATDNDFSVSKGPRQILPPSSPLTVEIQAGKYKLANTSWQIQAGKYKLANTILTIYFRLRSSLI
jgi:hypothetical protein